MLKIVLFFFILVFSFVSKGHHYKGLPHYSYFENYPQVPTMEFVGVHNGYEIFVTVYNFQGLDKAVVEDPNVIRLYSFIYHIETEKIYKGLAKFEIYSDKALRYETKWEGPEQENIFVIQKELIKQDDLKLVSYVKNNEGKVVRIDLPFQITKSFLQKFGIYICIGAFFLIVALIKTLSTKSEEEYGS